MAQGWAEAAPVLATLVIQVLVSWWNTFHKVLNEGIHRRLSQVLEHTLHPHLGTHLHPYVGHTPRLGPYLRHLTGAHIWDPHLGPTWDTHLGYTSGTTPGIYIWDHIPEPHTWDPHLGLHLDPHLRQLPGTTARPTSKPMPGSLT